MGGQCRGEAVKTQKGFIHLISPTVIVKRKDVSQRWEHSVLNSDQPMKYHQRSFPPLLVPPPHGTF